MPRRDRRRLTVPTPAWASESYVKLLANLGGVGLVLIGIGVASWLRSRPVPLPIAIPIVTVSPIREISEPPQPEPPAAAPRVAPELDRAAVAKAEAERGAAQRDRQRAEERLKSAQAALQAATAESGALALSAKKITERVRDPSARISRASARTGQIRLSKTKLEGQLAALEKTPRPRRKSLIDRTPVAKPAEGEEYHFEIRHDRVTVIPLQQLLDRVKADAQIRIRMDDTGRPISSTIGPVGAFSMRYELARSLPEMVEDMLDLRGPSYALRSWELIPEFEGRGETFEAAFRPASEFARTLNRLTPSRATITMWVYPDGFALYRKLRDSLHARGFLVAARPLPEGMAIRGSPAGSRSAGQ